MDGERLAYSDQACVSSSHTIVRVNNDQANRD